MNLVNCSSLFIAVEGADGPCVTHINIALCLVSGSFFLCVFVACFNNALLRVLQIHSTHIKEWIMASGSECCSSRPSCLICSCPAIKTCCINSNPLNWTGSPGLHTLLHNGEKWRNRETVSSLDQLLSLRFVFLFVSVGIRPVAVSYHTDVSWDSVVTASCLDWWSSWVLQKSLLVVCMQVCVCGLGWAHYNCSYKKAWYSYSTNILDSFSQLCLLVPCCASFSAKNMIIKEYTDLEMLKCSA